MEYALGLIRTHRYAYGGEGSEWYRSSSGAVCGMTRIPHCTSSDPTVIWCNGGRGSEALAKKSLSRSNSFFQFFIFWGFREDFDFSDFFSGPAKKDYDASCSLVQWIICHVPSWCSTRAVQDSTQSPSFIYRIPSISFISAWCI